MGSHKILFESGLLLKVLELLPLAIQMQESEFELIYSSKRNKKTKNGRKIRNKQKFQSSPIINTHKQNTNNNNNNNNNTSSSSSLSSVDNIDMNTAISRHHSQ